MMRFSEKDKEALRNNGNLLRFPAGQGKTTLAFGCISPEDPAKVSNDHDPPGRPKKRFIRPHVASPNEATNIFCDDELDIRKVFLNADWGREHAEPSVSVAL